MAVYKKFTKDNELYLFINGKLVYKKWLSTGRSKVFDIIAYDNYSEKSFLELHKEFDQNLLEINAQITLYPSDKGGKMSGIISGYRPNHVFEYTESGQITQTWIGDIIFSEYATIEPGESKTAKVRFVPAQSIEKYFQQGRIWWLHEGSRLIGEAKVL